MNSKFPEPRIIDEDPFPWPMLGIITALGIIGTILYILKPYLGHY